MNVNKAIIIGRLTRDPEARTTPSGKSVTSMAVASTSTWKDESGNKQEKTEFHDVVLWGRVAEVAAQYLVKGQEVYIEGRLETRNWEGKDGVTRYRTEIIVGADGRMQMGSKPQGSGYSSSNQGQDNKSISKADNSKQAGKQKKQGEKGDDEEEIKIEDIPF
ncbi:MAG: single-stranded DNA-binding protein [Candidatus Moranbacteria bacterium]|nr:single-stranded DNA-binding protein [Candidatus Moranbacteria bacterium]